MNRLKLSIAALVASGALLFSGCSAASTESTPATSTTATADAASSSDVDTSGLTTTEVTLTDEGLKITEAGVYVLSGSTTGQVVVDTEGDVQIVLNNATIASSEGAAIQVVNAENTVIELADGTTNTVSDASTRSDESIDAAIYSADDLIFTGSGALTVNASFADGIAGNDDVTIESGTITVTSADDAIKGKDSLTVSGGTLTIDAEGDGLKATNDTDEGEGQLVISGGKLTIEAGSQALKAEQQVSVTGGTMDINSVEGIEAPVIVIDDGEININASDDGINASASTFVTSGLSVTINGGDISITMASGDTDGIDSNGDLTIAGGTIDITGQSATDFDGTGTLSGGTLTVNGSQVTELTNQMMGGGGGPR